MKLDEDIISFLDLLDLNEEIIDLRLRILMKRSNFTNQHLTSLIYLLQYKNIINQKEDTDCENEEEYMFIGKLIACVNVDNIELISTIINKILLLHPSSIINKSEHLLQQLLADMNLAPPDVYTDTENDNIHTNTTMLNLQLCSSILNANIEIKRKILMIFLDTPLEYIVCSNCDKVRAYFLTNTVPKFFEAIEGYNILDRIWNYLKQLKNEHPDAALRVLCFLSNYYLPVTDASCNTKIESDILSHTELWDIILFGLSSIHYTHRKQSIYLAKRALDCLMNCKKTMKISYSDTLLWDSSKKPALKMMWDDYFILIDSLEEKQSNIVLPSLTLFNSIKGIGNCWQNCAFNIGLRHDNTQVRTKCIYYSLSRKTINESEARLLLEAINETNFYDNVEQYSVMSQLSTALLDAETFMSFLRSIPKIKWSPIPLFYVTQAIEVVNIDLIDKTDGDEIVGIINDILKIPCNNIIIRKAIHVNISWLIGKFKKLKWQQYIYLYSPILIDTSLKKNKVNNPLHKIIREDLLLSNAENKQLLEVIKSSNTYIDFALLYFDGHEDAAFIELVNKMILNIQDISKRSYSNKTECLNEAIFVTKLYHKMIKQGTCNILCSLISAKAYKVVLQYTMSLLSSDFVFSVEDISQFFEGLNSMVANFVDDSMEAILKLQKSTILLLNDLNVGIDKKVLSILVLNATFKNPKVRQLYEEKLVDQLIYKTLLNVETLSENQNKNIEGNGRLKNVFYEKTCEIFNLLIHNFKEISITPEIFDFIDNVIESGGYSCLKWILKILNRIIPSVLKETKFKYDIIQLLSRLWNEIEELKSNNQYAICIEEFVILITQDVLLRRPEYNNIVIMYCTKFIEYGIVKNLPMYLLAKQIQTTDVEKYSHLIYVLCDMLLYSFGQKKEHRITENVVKSILEDSKYQVCQYPGYYFDSHIHYLSVLALSNITEVEVLNTIMRFMMKKVDEVFKNKQRYHGNTQAHRTVQAAIQNLLFITLKSPHVDIERTALWCMELLGKIPHQPFVRTSLEWYIALYVYIKEIELNEELLKKLQSKHILLTSQFMILYWIVVHKIQLSECPNEVFQFVMDTLVSHTMGPTYSTRLYAQYLISRIAAKAEENELDLNKYKYVVKVVQTTLTNASKDKDKSFVRILNDYFVHSFDIIQDLSPCAIYYALPQLSGDSDIVVMDQDFFTYIFEQLNSNIDKWIDPKFNEKWRNSRKYFEQLQEIKGPTRVSLLSEHNKEEEGGTIQKKYFPWKSMSDVDIYEEKKNSKSDLIVVASLIDLLPNLGGMARTSEVFGVRSYVVNSIRHMQDKLFQGLSVSAEKWVNIEEVRPGQPLKDYLMQMKAKGYIVVAAEQTSSSSPLQTFKFPKKTLLVLGHEKEGVPCDLLPLMDFCVEIPQQGVIRSLNVHVTAAIFIWEYARQNML